MTASKSFMYPEWEPNWRFFHVVEPLNLNSYRFLFITVSDAEREVPIGAFFFLTRITTPFIIIMTP